MAHGEHYPSTDYSVLVGTVKDGALDPGESPSHYEIWIVAGDTNYRAAVNVFSRTGTDVFAYYDPDFKTTSPKLDLAALATSPGLTSIAVGNGGAGLDYLRDGLFPLERMQQIPASGQGVSLQNLLDAQVERAKADAGAVAIVFGNAFNDPTPDQTFGFSPDRGIHDIHMLQGDPQGSGYAKADRPNGDGALFIRYGGGETIALFIRFSTQSTDLPQ